MKDVIDGKVPSRVYYYLLDWNDADNWMTMRKMFNSEKLHQLKVEQVYQLFTIAAARDAQAL